MDENVKITPQMWHIINLKVKFDVADDKKILPILFFVQIYKKQKNP